jgi:NADH-quinone oxidoreductase subunit L
MEEVPVLVKWSATLAMLAGLGIAILFYIRAKWLPKKLAETNWPLYQFLLNKWYFDELYDAIFVKPAMWLGRVLWKQGDGMIIDGLGPDGVASGVGAITARVVKLQTGYVYHYAFAMLIGVAAIVSWFSFGGTH